jgi:predicted 3-demethylubiquinone-9 3-methyltransferase (glyoxalase superfamily)
MSARVPKTTLCLWYDRDAEDAAKFYAGIFPGSSVGDAPMKKIDVSAIDAAVRADA